MFCWGYNDAGELGQGFADFTIYALTGPQQVLDPAGGAVTYTSISSGSAHTCAVASGSNEVYCWGYNSLWDGAMDVPSGQIGDGTYDNALLPTLVSGGRTWSSMDVGLYHSCAVTTAGQLYCWGNNAASQLGSNGTTSQNTPVAVDFP